MKHFVNFYSKLAFVFILVPLWCPSGKNADIEKCCINVVLE